MWLCQAWQRLDVIFGGKVQGEVYVVEAEFGVRMTVYQTIM